MTGSSNVSLKGERCVRLWTDDADDDAGVLTMMWMIGVFWRSQTGWQGKSRSVPNSFLVSRETQEEHKQRE